MTLDLAALSRLDDRALLSRVRELARQDTRMTAVILAHLGEVDARQLYLGEGHTSLFDYTRRLGYSEGESYKRCQAARLCRRLPEVLGAVAEGRLHLSGVCVLAPHLNPENVADVISAASGRSKRELESLAYELSRPAQIELTRDAPVPPAQPSFDFGGVAIGDVTSPFNPDPSGPRSAAATPTPTPGLRPSAPNPSAPFGLRPLTVRATPALLAKLERARALDSHRGCGTAEVLERALDLFIADREKARFAVPKSAPKPVSKTSPKAAQKTAAKAPRPDPTPARGTERTRDSRRPRIPTETLRFVYERDEGCCTFTGTGGHRCGSRFKVQVHHRQAWARRGTHDPKNLTLHCARHNRFVAEQEGLGRPTKRKEKTDSPSEPKTTPG